jgi:hypothetical protein
MNTTEQHYERQERISKVADLLVDEAIENGEAFSEELTYRMWSRAKQAVDALDGEQS